MPTRRNVVATDSLIRFADIESLPNMEAVREYLGWDKPSDLRTPDRVTYQAEADENLPIAQKRTRHFRVERNAEMADAPQNDANVTIDPVDNLWAFCGLKEEETSTEMVASFSSKMSRIMKGKPQRRSTWQRLWEEYLVSAGQ